ncbi:MAG: hypothetical protein GY814_13935 [Gammaproteobacteria bacterium]|nr:hypothetical protein [Gammaproteobacteria bacterium]
MKIVMRNGLLLLMLLLSVHVWASGELKPQFERVELKENTVLQLAILPDAGTQLIFPFELNNPDLVPPLKIRLTNTDGFEVPTAPKDIEIYFQGQNTISILGKPSKDKDAGKQMHRGFLFINVGGYNLSIALHTTYNMKEHVSNIVFDITDAERVHMVEAAIK